MRSYHQLVFDDSVEGTTPVYTNSDFNDLMAVTEVIEIIGYAAQVSGTNPTVTVRSQVSGDGRNFGNNNATPEVNAAALSTTGMTGFTGKSPSTDSVFGFRRLEISLGGTGSLKAYIRLYVTGRGEQVLR